MTIHKIKTKSGIRWKALYRRGNRSKSKTFRLKSSAQDWEDEIYKRHELAKALGIPGKAVRFEELADEYMEQYKGKDHTRENRVRFWRDRLKGTPLTDISAAAVKSHLSDYLNGCALSYGGIGQDCKTKTRELDRKRSPASRNRMLAALGATLTYAVHQEYISRPVVSSLVPFLQENNQRVNYLSKKERKRLLRECMDSEYDKLYLLVMMAYSTGCRQGELMSLRWQDIDLEKKAIYFQSTKNKDPKMVMLSPSVLEELSSFTGAKSELIFNGKRKKDKSFSGFRAHWESAKERACIKNFTFHDIRHDSATILAGKGKSLLEIGEFLGHKTMEGPKRYAHLTTSHKKEIMETLSEEIDIDS